MPFTSAWCQPRARLVQYGPVVAVRLSSLQRTLSLQIKFSLRERDWRPLQARNYEQNYEKYLAIDRCRRSACVWGRVGGGLLGQHLR